MRTPLETGQSQPPAESAPADSTQPSATSTEVGPSPTPTPPATSTPSSPTTVGGGVEIGEVPTAQWAAMKRARMVRPECPVQRRSQLRRIDVPFIDFNGNPQQGHLIVRRDAAESVARIFTRLYEMQFPIRRMQGVEAYNGDVYKSLAADNTSSYNCRRAGQINAPFSQSPHANGRAVDINPVENPWKDPRCTCWSPTGKYAERDPGPGKILKNDRVWRTFDAEGWIWQNIDVPDYMHFDTGYPSRPYRGRN